jgi:class 3 adenylate cyclase
LYLGPHMNAWIETADGNRIAVESNCHFGRAAINEVRLNSPGASRRHAHIHAQQADNHVEYWLADLGSTNGTLLNGKRVTIPCRLKSGDGIRIVDEEFVFKMEFNAFESALEAEFPPTVPVRASRQCWLLMVDIKRYTSLATQLETDVLAQKVGTWLRQCRDIVEAGGGVVDKFLGDAIFAYWMHGEGTPTAVAKAVRELSALQRGRDPDFRLVIHHGLASITGGAGGADNLSGSDVIYVFRMEKVCSKLGDDSIVSAAAAAALPADCRCEPVGAHALDGFPGTHPLFRLVREVGA